MIHQHDQNCAHDHSEYVHTNCPFCKIGADIDAGQYDPVYADEVCMIIHDIAPESPVHLLVIPRFPVESLEDLTPGLLYHLILKGLEASSKLGFVPKIVINEGAEVGKTIQHLHIHFRSS
jgi:histidine triad (HIT) family protein